MRQGPLPLYYQLKEILRSWITDGRFKAGQRFPSESELQRRFNVSRVTIRRALSELVNEGLLVREKGRGSFVVKPWMKEDLGPLNSFTEEMQRRGLPCRSEILDFRVVIDEEVAQKMEVPLDEELVRLQRVRLVQDEPLALQTNFVRHRFCPGLIEKGLLGESLYRTLEEAYGLELGWARQSLVAKLADHYEAKLLRIKAGQPLLAFERVTYLRNGVPIEYVRSVYRGDRYQFVIKLKRTKKGGEEG